jgi:hypothetical protein
MAMEHLVERRREFVLESAAKTGSLSHDVPLFTEHSPDGSERLSLGGPSCDLARMLLEQSLECRSGLIAIDLRESRVTREVETLSKDDAQDVELFPEHAVSDQRWP